MIREPKDKIVSKKMTFLLIELHQEEKTQQNFFYFILWLVGSTCFIRELVKSCVGWTVYFGNL